MEATNEAAFTDPSDDDVAVALTPLIKGMETEGLCLLSDIPAGHKVALRNIQNGERVIKYGMPIGQAIMDISAGEHVHCHNLHTLLSGKQQYTYTKVAPPLTPQKPASFNGYLRASGSAGGTERALDSPYGRLRVRRCQNP